jgi:hypothetical protein
MYGPGDNRYDLIAPQGPSRRQIALFGLDKALPGRADQCMGRERGLLQRPFLTD